MNDAGNGITEQAAAHEEEKKKQLSRVREIERTIVKTYRKDIWGRFVKAVACVIHYFTAILHSSIN